MAQNCARQWVFVSVMSKLAVLLLQSSLVSTMDLTNSFKNKLNAMHV